MNCRCCFIIPPYLLEKMAQSDNPGVRERALATLASLDKAHAMRMAMAKTLNVESVPAAAPPTKRRRVFSCDNTDDLSRTLLLQEGDPPSNDVAAREAYDYSGVTWDFFHEHFGRNSIDNRGMTLVSSIHYSENGRGYDNALWYGRQMVYGDGDELFGRMTQCLDVVAHELSHGVTELSAGLPYELQSGALNEHFSDVFGVAVRQWREKEKDPQGANWLIGDNLLLAGGALRSMKKPGTANTDDPQPGHMKDFVVKPNTTQGDYGGVHYNSGIPNKAFYLAAVAIGEPAWTTATRIWYLTLTERLKGETSFEKCAYETVSVARDYVSDKVASLIAQAWMEVGVLSDNSGPVASLKMKAAQKHFKDLGLFEA